MADTAVIALEGVLRGPQGQPIREGVALYHSLKAVHKLVLVADEMNQAQAEHWLQTEGLRDHVKLLCADVAIDGQDIRFQQIRVLNGLELRPSLLVDPSPSRCASAIAQGYTTLLFAQPKYSRPEWRVDNPRGRRAWSDIEAELATQAEQRAKDPRVDAEMTPG